MELKISFFYHQLVYCTRNISRIKRESHKKISFLSLKHYAVDHLGQGLSKLDLVNYETKLPNL